LKISRFGECLKGAHKNADLFKTSWRQNRNNRSKLGNNV